MTHSDHTSLHKQGVPRSEATKQAISDALKGVPKSEEHKKALSDALKGVKPWNKGVPMGPMSEATTKAIGEANSKKILQFTKSGEFVREWASMTAIWQELGIAQSNISACCQGKLKSAGGYVWKYA